MCWCFIHYWIEKCTVKQWNWYIRSLDFFVNGLLLKGPWFAWNALFPKLESLLYSKVLAERIFFITPKHKWAKKLQLAQGTKDLAAWKMQDRLSGCKGQRGQEQQWTSRGMCILLVNGNLYIQRENSSYIRESCLKYNKVMGLHSWKSESRAKQCTTERFLPSLPHD